MEWAVDKHWDLLPENYLHPNDVTRTQEKVGNASEPAILIMHSSSLYLIRRAAVIICIFLRFVLAAARTFSRLGNLASKEHL
jgi:hypothetical protein